MSGPSLVADFDKLIRDAQLGSRIPSVSAAAIHRGRTVWSAATGFADLESERVATTDTQYRVGSITKMFTAAAVMQLRDAGAVDLDDSVSTHVPEFPHRKIKIRDVLAHVSGLQMETPGNVWVSPEGPSTLEFTEQLRDTEQILKTNTYWHYSNLGYALMGQLVARGPQQVYERVVERQLLHPLDMCRTTWDPTASAAQGYFVEPYSDLVRRESHASAGAMAPAAQLWSTSEDLIKWAAFMADPDPAVMAPDTVEEMHVLRTMADSEHWTLGWGLGPSLIRSGEHILAGHGGGMPGFRAGVLYLRSERIGAAVLMNSSSTGDPVGIAAQIILRILENSPVDADPWRAELALPPSVQGILGRWWSEGVEWTLVFRGNRLEARQQVHPHSLPAVQVLTEVDTDHFRVSDGSLRGESLEVIRDSNGEVTSMTLATNPMRREPGPA